MGKKTKKVKENLSVKEKSEKNIQNLYWFIERFHLMIKSQFSNEKYFQGINFSKGYQLLLTFQPLTKPEQSLS